MSSNAASGAALPSLILNEDHYERLLALAEQARQSAPDVASYLLTELDRAELRPAGDMPATVVDVHTEVDYEDLAAGTRRTLQLVWPREADAAHQRLSVISPVGAALIGLSAGQEINWQLRDGGVRRLRVLAVRPAPRAA